MTRKLIVHFKTPDALHDALHYATVGLCDGDIQENRMEAERIAGKWIKYGEQLSVEIDLDAETATVRAVRP